MRKYITILFWLLTGWVYAETGKPIKSTVYTGTQQFMPSAIQTAPALDAQMVVVSDDITTERQKARGMFASLDAQNQYRDSITSFEDLAVLPLGIDASKLLL